MGQMSCWAILQITDANFQLTRLYQRKNLRYKTSLIKVTFRWSSPDHLKTSLPNHILKALLFNNTGWRRGMLKLASSLLPAKSNWQGLEPLSRVSLTTLLRYLPIKEPRQYLRFQGAQKLKFLQDLRIPKKLESKTNHRVKRQSFVVFWMVP